MKKVLLDTNVVLDFALKREPFYEDALQAQIAVRSGMDAIVTRNNKDYKKIQTTTKIVLPIDFIKYLQNL